MYDFTQIEESTLEYWEQKKIYEKTKKKNSKGKNFYFLQGPPYTSGRLHIGHAWNNSLKDIVLRYKRMNGFNVWDRAGYDMHGLPTENAVQKKLKIKDKTEIEKFGVEKFINECSKFSIENAYQMDKDLMRLGIWMDFKNAYWPVKNEFIEGEWWLIKKAWSSKRLYKGKKIMQWCASCETSLAKHELEYENLKDKSIYVAFKLKGKEGSLVIWTTTPWTIPFNLGVMVNPDIEYAKLSSNQGVFYIAKDLIGKFKEIIGDEKAEILETIKGKNIVGWEYLHPFSDAVDYASLKQKYSKIHTVLLSKEYVNLEAGTGLVHCAPGCGPEDYEVGQRYSLPAFNTIDEKGIFSGVGEFNNWVAKKDDEKFIKALDERRVLLGAENISHEYPHCWRCHNPVVFRATEQWFLKIEDLIPNILEFNKKVNWQPKISSKNYDLWIENLKDNGITRQRYWGCPAPIWVCDNSECKHVEVIENRKEIEKKGGKAPKDLHKPWIDAVKLNCTKCKGKMTRIPDVIDVWVDSGTTSWNCLYYPETNKYFNLWPADFILEATEQIRLWFSMLQMCSAIAFGKSSYKNVYCHGMILDYQGMKMSKSLGNIISPYEIVDKYGADILRYYMCGTPAGENINFNWEEVKVKQRNMNILYNLHKFILDLRKQTKPKNKQSIEENYILSRKNLTIQKVNGLLEEYRIDETIKEIEGLFLDLSRIYIRLTRDKSSSDEAGQVLYALENTYLDILKMFSVICPFITDYLYIQTFGKESVHLCDWPKIDKKKIDKNLENRFDLILKIVEAGLASRDKVQIGLKWPLKSATIMGGDYKFNKEEEELIKLQLNVKQLFYRESHAGIKDISVDLDTALNPELEAEGYAREISRQIQAFRKTLGLEKQDKIELAIFCDDNFAKILQTQEDFLKERTNSKILKFNKQKKETFKNKTDFKIKDNRGEIGIIYKNTKK
ncbi:MAG TPA: isoleucine--tRNA ligase [Candidatus Nanoarchaeia archaeon]|nr:isoleucine--tRNA ligase [Candidatus Nanoarchaeia archaeon]